MNRKIPRAIASNKEAMWREGCPHLLRDVMAHAREGRMAITGMVGDKGLVGRPTKGDGSAADLGLMTERGSNGCDVQVLMNTRPRELSQTVRPTPAPRDCHHRRRIPRSSRGKEKGWTWGKSRMTSVLLRTQTRLGGCPSIRASEMLRLVNTPMRNTRSLTIPNLETEIEHRRRSPYVNLFGLICLSTKPNRLKLAAPLPDPARISDTVVPLCSSGSPEWKISPKVNSSPSPRFILVLPPAPIPLVLHDHLQYSQGNPGQLTMISTPPMKVPSTLINTILIPSRISFVGTIQPLKPNATIGPPESIPRSFWSAPVLFGWPRRRK